MSTKKKKQEDYPPENISEDTKEVLRKFREKRDAKKRKLNHE